MIKAVGYIRVSTSEQAQEGVSLAAQLARIEAYCAFQELELVDVIEDAGVSAGQRLSSRRGGRLLLAAVEQGGAGAVIAAKLDRLFRDAVDCLGVTRQWDKAGVGLHLLDLGVDTSSPMGRAFLTMAAAFAELERNLAAERTREGLAQVIAEGGDVGAPGFGWRYADGPADGSRRRCVPVAAERAVVHDIRGWREAGMSYRAIAAELEAGGQPTKRGGRWHPDTVRKIALRAAARRDETRGMPAVGLSGRRG